MVKALRYQSDGTGINSRWCHWGILSVVPPTEPCALRSTQSLKVNTREFSWGKGGRCVWPTTYHPLRAETSRKSGNLIYPEPLGPPRPVAGLYITLLIIMKHGGNLKLISNSKFILCRSQWPRGLRRRSAAARMLRLWDRIPPGAWIFVCCECCVLSGRGLCDGLNIRSEESYRMWRVVVGDQETSQARRLKPTRGL